MLVPWKARDLSSDVLITSIYGSQEGIWQSLSNDGEH